MANPEAGAVTNEESAVERVASLLEPEESKPKEPTSKQPEQEEPETAEPVDEAEAESEEESSEEPDTEPESEDEELPDTLEALAEALNMESADLAGHLKVPIKVNGKIEHVTLSEAMKGQAS